MSSRKPETGSEQDPESGHAGWAKRLSGSMTIERVALTGLAITLVVIGLDIAGLHVDLSTVALLLLAALFLAAFSAPDEVVDALRRVTTFKVGSVEVALGERDRAERVVERFPKKEDEVATRKRTVSGDRVSEVLEVRQEMEKKLRYVRDHLLEFGADQQAYGDVITRLRSEELINEDELNVIFYVFGDDVASWPKESRRRFLDAAWELAVRFATHTFERYVRKKVAESGLAVVDFEQSRKHRRDFFIDNGKRFLVAARVADPWDSMQPVRERLERAPFQNVERVIIVPDKTKIRKDGICPKVRIERLSDFLARSTAEH